MHNNLISSFYADAAAAAVISSMADAVVEITKSAAELVLGVVENVTKTAAELAADELDNTYGQENTRSARDT